MMKMGKNVKEIRNEKNKLSIYNGSWNNDEIKNG